MKKEQLINLLNFGIISPSEKRNYAFIEKVFDLDKEKLDLIFEYPQFITFSRELIARDLPTNKYKYVYNVAKRMGTENLESLAIIVCNDNLLNSHHYEYVVNLAARITESNTLYAFSKIAVDEKLIASKEYRYIIDLASGIKDIEILQKFFELATDEALINSNDYRYILHLGATIGNGKKLENFINLAHNHKLMNCNYYKYVLNIASKFNDPYNLFLFYNIATDENLLNSQHYKTVIDLANQLKDSKYFNTFEGIAIDKNLIFSHDYLSILKQVSEITNKQILINILNTIKTIPDTIERLTIINRIIATGYDGSCLFEIYKLIIGKTTNLNYKVLAQIFTSRNCEEIEKRLEEYKETLNVKDDEIDEIYNDGDHKLVEIMCLPDIEILTTIESLPNDEEINSKTLVHMPKKTAR